MSREEFFNRYTYNPKTDLIGSGGFANVYKAYDNVLDIEVAIKVAAYKPETRSLVEEFGAIHHLKDHVHISNYEAVYKFTLDTGIFEFAVMQYYPQGSVKDLMKTELSQEDKVGIAKGLISGLHYLHNNKVIHRDLKWNNVLASKNPNTQRYVVKISDFGLSKRVENINDSLIANSINSGTYAYLSPENFQFFDHHDKRSDEKIIKFNFDLWALGIMLFELFVGEVPFPLPKNEINANIATRKQIESILDDAIPDVVNDIPEPFGKVVKACLIKNPFERIRSIDQIVEMVGLNDFHGRYQSKPTVDKDNEDTIKNKNPSIETEAPKRLLVLRYTHASAVLIATGIILLIAFGPFGYKIGSLSFSDSISNLDSVSEGKARSKSPASISAFLTFFADEFNSTINKETRFQIYAMYKDSLGRYLSPQTLVLQNDVITDFESLIVSLITKEDSLEILDKKILDNGKFEFITFK